MKSFVITAAVALSIVGCGKPDAPAPAPPASAGATAPAATAAPAPAPAKPAFVQKGVAPGKVIVGYIQDSADPNQCAAVTDAPAKKDEFTKDGDKLAQMVKGKVVPSCPTDNVVGTCNAGFGMLVNYSGPKWTAETAKKDCTSHAHQTWMSSVSFRLSPRARPAIAPYVAGSMKPKARAILDEIARMADASGLVSELPLLDLAGTSDALAELLTELEHEQLITREPSDRVRITPAGVAAAHPEIVPDAGDGYPPG